MADYKFLLKKKRKRTVVTETKDGQWIADHVFSGFLHARKAKRWLSKYDKEWEQV
jgi:hypothetical protein